MKNKLPYLNVGCGRKFDPSWHNIDVLSSDPEVRKYDLTKGLPYSDNSFKAVYHSHVLEHIPRDIGRKFVSDCFRVLDSGGVIRIVVPDLEKIISEYQNILSRNSPENDMDKYEWNQIELFDQVSRNFYGGEMKRYILSGKESRYVAERIGEEGSNLVEATSSNSFKDRLYILKISFRNFLLKFPIYKYYSIGKFRNSGEIHYCMYDRYSLSYLLKSVGFDQIIVRTAEESYIESWSKFELDSKNGRVSKPDSLFIEAIKP